MFCFRSLHAHPCTLLTARAERGGGGGERERERERDLEREIILATDILFRSLHTCPHMHIRALTPQLEEGSDSMTTSLHAGLVVSVSP